MIIAEQKRLEKEQQDKTLKILTHKKAKSIATEKHPQPPKYFTTIFPENDRDIIDVKLIRTSSHK